MTIHDRIIRKAQALGLRYETTTSTWDIHSGISTGKNSNFYKVSQKINAKNVIGIPGRRGWGQHTATDLLIFSSNNIITFDTEMELSRISNAPCGWIAIAKKTEDKA